MKAHPPGGTIEGIQWLRAIAALMVVTFHARYSVQGSDAWPTFGAAGVDIFFIISGFVMAHTTRRLDDESGPEQRLGMGGDFLRKRLARVVPLYWVALLWTARRELMQDGASVDLVKDALFFPRLNGSYPDMLWPVIIQGWTLNYEMFFYALFALSMLCGRRRLLVLLGGLLMLVALGLLANTSDTSLTADDWTGAARRFYMDNILLEFGFGVLLQKFVSHSRQPDWPRGVYMLFALLGFVLLAVGQDRWPRAVTQGLPALLIVWASLAACRGLRSRILEKLADASYAIYLFHWASFGAVKPMAAWLGGLGAFSGRSSTVQVTVLMLLHIVVAVFSGLLVHAAIERPLLRVSQHVLGLRPAGSPTRVPA
jgi:exopolysaccharide production protein ExoZ